MIRLVMLCGLLTLAVVVQGQETVPSKSSAKDAKGAKSLESKGSELKTSELKSNDLKTPRDQASYAIGMNIARNMKREGLEINPDALVMGIIDALTNAKPKLTDEQARAALEVLDREMQQQLAEKNKIISDKNKKDGQAYLAANKTKQGVVALPSGLQYTVLKSGKGPTPTDKDMVKAHYHGTLIDGKVFDSSVERGEPLVIPVGGVIRGWTEALKKMKVGDKWRLVVPPELAYGPQGAPPDIGPNAVLIFEVELLGIEPKQ